MVLSVGHTFEEPPTPFYYRFWRSHVDTFSALDADAFPADDIGPTSIDEWSEINCAANFSDHTPWCGALAARMPLDGLMPKGQPCCVLLLRLF